MLLLLRHEPFLRHSGNDLAEHPKKGIDLACFVGRGRRDFSIRHHKPNRGVVRHRIARVHHLLPR